MFWSSYCILGVKRLENICVFSLLTIRKLLSGSWSDVLHQETETGPVRAPVGQPPSSVPTLYVPRLLPSSAHFPLDQQLAPSQGRLETV